MQAVPTIWDRDEFARARHQYGEAEKHCREWIAQARAASVRTVISKGQLYDVLPFEVERHGEKRNGRIIAEPIAHDNCHIHHFDARGRIILKETMSAFSGRPEEFSLYFYTADALEHVSASSAGGVARYQKCLLSDGRVRESFVWATYGAIYEVYIYDTHRIVSMQCWHREFKKQPGEDSFQVYDYLYGEEKVLQQIWLTYEDGSKSIVFSARQVNFKQLERRILGEMLQAVENFVRAHPTETFTRFGAAVEDPEFLILYLDTGEEHAIAESPADWSFADFATLNLIEFPLDDNQTAKLVVTVARAVGAMVGSETFARLRKTPDFKIVVFDRQGVADKRYAKVRDLLPPAWRL